MSVSIRMTREDLLAIEEAAHSRISNGATTEGFWLLGRCLAWRYDSGIGGEIFACTDIDESAGMADVVELQGYSKRIPCE